MDRHSLPSNSNIVWQTKHRHIYQRKLYHEDKKTEEYLIQPHDGRTVWNGVESKDEDTESKEKEYVYERNKKKTGSDGKNLDEISLEELDGEGNEKLTKQGDEVKSKE